jgi:hypothetical protein
MPTPTRTPTTGKRSWLEYDLVSFKEEFEADAVSGE